MGSLTVRNVPDEDLAELRVVAARNGRSMEAEVRAMIHQVGPRHPDVRRPAREDLPRISPDLEARIASIHADIRSRLGELPKGRVDAFLAERRQAAERGE